MTETCLLTARTACVVTSLSLLCCAAERDSHSGTSVTTLEMISLRRFARSNSRRALLAGLALIAFFAQAVAAADSTISITTEQRIQVGDAVKFQWRVFRFDRSRTAS